MLLIHYVSVMMWIFCMDWQQYWKYGWILNIGANAHGKRTVSTKQPQRKWQTWQSGFQWHRETCIELVFKSLNSFTLRLFNSATIFFMLHVFVFETQLQCIYCLVTYTDPPRVFRRFKRRSCLLYPPLQRSWKGGILVSPCPSVRLSVCGQNRVRSVSSTILIGSISYVHILSSNFRRCVACNARFKIQKFELLANFLNL